MTSHTITSAFTDSTAFILAGQYLTMDPLIYGTAWKQGDTARLVYEAIRAGFRSIDTAAMARHYNETGCGEGIRRAVRERLVSRYDLYVQTKFSPFDEAYSDAARYPDIASQVHSSVSQSLNRLRTSDLESHAYLDCVVLHSPYPRRSDTIAAWQALSVFVPNRVRSLGISNIGHAELQALLNSAEAMNVSPPAVVQNRFTAREQHWDAATRTLCAARKIVYQGFWTLTANQNEWQTAEYVGVVAAGAGVSRAVAWYALMTAMDIVVLNGTTSVEHMREDLAGLEKVQEWQKTQDGKKAFEKSLMLLKKRTGTLTEP